MKKGDYRLDDGFTVIEVALVLGIAGLIFLMVFIALPGLQRSQKDAQRREAVSTLINAVKKYQSNNRGALPSGTGIIRYQSGNNQTNWTGFYSGYLGDKFIDPDGSAYTLRVVNCTNMASLKVGNVCNVSGSQIDPGISFTANDYTMHVVLQAECNGDQTVYSENPRKLAVLYRLEGAGVYCANT